VSDGHIFPETPSWRCGETGKRKGRRKEKEYIEEVNGRREEGRKGM